MTRRQLLTTFIVLLVCTGGAYAAQPTTATKPVTVTLIVSGMT